jgi:RimJ/RimL family protein N-acetyltransferase
MPFTINQTSPGDAEILALAQAASPKPFEYYRRRAGYDEADITYAQCIRNALQSPQATPLELREDGRLRGVVALKHLDWDTEIYGFPMGKADFLTADVQGNTEAVSLRHELLSALISLARSRGYRHLVFRTDPYDLGGIHAAEALGFRFMDALTVHACNCRLADFDPADYPQIKIANEDDRSEVTRITRASFAGNANRYSLDWRLPPDGVLKLYEKWMTDGIGKAEHVVAIARDPKTGRGVGCSHGGPYAIVGQTNPIKITRVVLTAVDPDYRGRWVMPEVGGWMRGMLRDLWGYHFLETVLHVNNLAAIRVADILDTNHIAAEISFHLWLD